MSMFKRVAAHMVALVAAVVLASCGGSGDAGTSVFGSSSGASGVTGTVTSTAPADLILTLSKTSLSDTGSDTVTVTATALNASRNALTGVAVALAVDNNAVAVVPTTSTDASGNVTATVSAGSDRSNRIVTVTAVTGTITRTASFQVTGAALTGTALPAVVVPGSTGNVIQYRLVDAAASPLTGQTITISGAGITGATGTTGINGDYAFTYTAPVAAGNLEVTATAGGVTTVSEIIVQSSSGGIAAASIAVNSASVRPDPTVVNIAGTSNIRALFVGPNNAPVPRVRARFDLNGDVNSIGGTLASGTGVIYSDANGVASTTYTAGTRSGPTDGLTVRVCYSPTDFAAGTCPNSATATLTVVSDALAVTIGTNNLITSGAGGLTYIKQYVMLVVDASGQAKSDVLITPSIDLKTYRKGFYTGPGAWTQTVTAECLNEDINRNGVLETGEDINGNGALDPRKSDVAISMVGSATTGADGTAILQIEYPQNVASWDTFEIDVSASGVTGTEGRATWRGILGVDAAALSATTPPSFVLSPYGVATSCSNPN